MQHVGQPFSRMRKIQMGWLTRLVVHMKYAARRPALFANAKNTNGLALKKEVFDMKKVTVLLSPPNSSDISIEEMKTRWEELNEIPNVQCNIVTYTGRQTPDLVNELIPADADAVIGVFLQKAIMTESFFDSHPNLKYMAGTAHGYEEIDKSITKKYGVTVTNTIYGSNTIAQFAFALLLDICHHVELHNTYLKQHDWAHDAAPRFMQSFTTQIELCDLTFGIIGLGSIGFCAAKIANGFGMKVLAYSRHKKEGAQYDFIEQVPLDELYARSDVISIHTPLTNETKGMINKHSIAKMKDGVIFINTSRGGLVVEDDLVEALNSGKIYAAGLDVISEEPPRSNLPILSCKNATITPHIAYLPKSSRFRSVRIAIDNYKAYLAGHPTSVVS